MLFLYNECTQTFEIFPLVRQEGAYIFIVNIMDADVPPTQGARASSAIILAQLNRDNSVPTR